MENARFYLPFSAKNTDAEPSEIQEFLESKLDKRLTAEAEKEYRYQKKMEYGEYGRGFVPPRESEHYVGKVDQEPLSRFEQVVHEPLIPKELYESAVKKIQERSEHTPAEEQSYQSKQDYFFKRLDALLPLVDLYKLDELK